VRYPRGYARDRDAWALLVTLAVREARWRPPLAARYRVEVAVYGGGKRDLDRVCTAVLDALQTGGAVRDDCLVDTLTACRYRLPVDQQPTTVVQVAALPSGERPNQPSSQPSRARPSRKGGHHEPHT
jgi:Holliday junction resolvase RusA-like endonuclease